MRYTQEEWKAEAQRRLGENFMNWKFKCPMCGHVASVRDFKNAGASDPNCAYTECIGRYTGKGAPQKGDSSGCNWCSYGLFGIPNDNADTIILPDGKEIRIFQLAEVSVGAPPSEH